MIYQYEHFDYEHSSPDEIDNELSWVIQEIDAMEQKKAKWRGCRCKPEYKFLKLDIFELRQHQKRLLERQLPF